MNKWVQGVALALAACASSAVAAEFVWLEGESGKTTVTPTLDGWGTYLSEGKWLRFNFDADAIDKAVTADSAGVTYEFEIKKNATYEIWNRVGMEFVRSAFEWRIDQGEWKKLTPDDLTTDLMEMSKWNEIAWLKMGDQQLAAGKHTLEIRVPKTKNKDGKSERMIYVSDAICINEGPFKPNSKFKPNETGRTEADLAAEKFVFKLPEPKPGERASVSLAGTWEIARADEQMPGEVAAPITDLPTKDSVFRAIPVPSNKNVSRPDLVFAHRLWYRTRIDVPASADGRSFQIDFPLNNLNTTVVVNGQQCGFFKDPFARFQIDVTKAIKPGQVNEILVGIRDAWYGRTADPDRPLKLRKTFNIPMDYFGQGFQDLDYPIWNCPQSGILCTPTFVSAGGVYTSDVFVKPSVEKKQMIAEVTVSNPGAQDASGEIRWEAIDDKTNQVAKAFAAKPFTVAAGKTQTLEIADAWADAKLWWPDQPNLYRLRTSVVVGGRALDSNETLFGFREWKIDGMKFTLNGIVWHLWADLIGKGESKETWLKAHAESGVRTYRYSTAGQAGQDPHWFGLEPQQALEFMDRNGIVVRRNSTLDGETIGSNFSEGDAELVKKRGWNGKKKLMENWRDQCVAQVKGERNHPSIQIWTIENEFAYINLINLLGNSPLMDQYEAEIKKTHDAVMAADPTRSVMIDGGGALKDNSLGVHGDHYVNTIDGRYPDLAYDNNTKAGGRGRWEWDMKRPRFIGEDYFATGVNPADYAVIGGEIAFQGKAATKEAVATMYRILQEGYRWGGTYAAWHFWLGGEGGPRSRLANAPRAVFTREWDWSFGGGQKVKRTFGVFNDTQYADPITFTRTLSVGGKELYRKSSQHNVKPGTAEKFEEEIAMPAVQARAEGELVMTLAVNGKEIFKDTKAVSVLPAAKGGAAPSSAVALWDPKNISSGPLKAMGVAFTPANSLEALPADAKVLIVGSDAISAKDATSTALAAYASAGRVVIVLDQSEPLRYQALPAEMEPAPSKKRSRSGEQTDLSEGRMAFIEDASHPALKGLADKDFFTWTGDHVVYRNAYEKPTRGGKSLIQVGPRLSQSVLTEVPVGKGVIYLCQLDLAEKLATNAVAQQLLSNLVSYGQQYKQEFANVSAVVSDEQLAKALDATGVQYAKAADVLSAISDADKKIAVVSATPENLKALAGNMPRLQAFWGRGGTILLHNVTPDGLADFNKIVGVEHAMRKFGRERVTFPAVKNPLTSGITTGDIVMLSGKRIFGWTADEYVAPDVFNYIVDYDEVAPFGKSDFHAYGNITNGFVGSDGWPLIIDFPAPKQGETFDIKIELPKEETITELTYDQSMNYNPTTKIAMLFDGKDRVEFSLQPNGDPQTFAIEPARKAKTVTLQVVEWSPQPGKTGNVGIDNIYLKVQRSSEFLQTVRPMLNLGGMMQYVKGTGGVVLCNLNLQENEAVPVNKTKKRTIIATVLRNLKAPFAGGKSVIAGSNLDYTMLDIHTKATTYKDDRGWFGNKNRTFAGLQQGKQNLAGVQYSVYEMPTSPVPQVLMLAGKGIPGNLPNEITGIPVNTKADALFFLHTARLNQRMNDREREQKKRFPLFRYVVNFADGEKVDVPIISEIDINHYIQKDPQALPGAQVAWTMPYEKSDEQAVAYSKQWNNPKPDVEIKTIDMIPVDANRGTPVLIAITAAKAR